MANVEVGTVVVFNYDGGTTPGKRRAVYITEKNSNYLVGWDFTRNNFREFKNYKCKNFENMEFVVVPYESEPFKAFKNELAFNDRVNRRYITIPKSSPNAINAKIYAKYEIKLTNGQELFGTKYNDNNWSVFVYQGDMTPVIKKSVNDKEFVILVRTFMQGNSL